MRSYFFRLFALCYLVIGFNNIFAQKWIPVNIGKEDLPFSSEIIESNTTVYKVKFSIHGLYDKLIENDYGCFHHLSLGNNAYLSNIGEPALPLITQLVAIPNNGDYYISVEEGNWIDIEMDTIYPAQKPLLERESDVAFFMDASVYSNIYKSSMIHKGEEMDWRGVRNVNVSICPFKYYPNKNKLSVLCDFILQISFSKSDKQNNETNEDIWGIFDNNFETSAVKRYSSETYDYLIIVGNDSILNSQTYRFSKMESI